MNKEAIYNIFNLHLLVISLIIIVSVFSSSCIANDKSPKAPNQLIFGARTDAEPLSYKDGENWRGYSIDLCKEIYIKYREDYANYARSQGIDLDPQQSKQLNFVPVEAPERMDALQKGRVDVLCGATTVTVSRMEYVDFTLLTFVSGISIMKKKGTDSSIIVNTQKTIGGGVKITYVGCTEGMDFIDCTTTDNWIANRFGSSIQPTPKQSHTEAFNALDKGEVQFYAGDRVILEYKLIKTPNAEDFDLAPSFLTFEPYAIAIAKGNELLLYSANSTLAELYRNGDNGRKIDQIYLRYFPNKQKSQMLEKMYQLQAFPK